MQRVGILVLAVLPLVLSCSSSQKKEEVENPLGTFLPFTLVYQSGRQGTFQASKSTTTPFGGLDRESNALEFIRSEPTQVLYVDGGNLFLSEDPKADLEKARADSLSVVEALNLLSLDVFSPGPTDWRLGKESLKKISKAAAFRFVATNVMDENDKRIFPAYQLVQRGDHTFAFLSVIPEGWYGNDVHATSPKTALNKWVWQAAIRADFIIVLSQLGNVAEDRKILEKYPKVQMVIGNDPRRTLESPEWVRGRLLFDGYRHGLFLGKMTFELRNPFFGFISEPLLEKAKLARMAAERELAEEQDVTRRSEIQAKIVKIKENHPEEKVSGTSRFFHELIALDATRFGKTNEISVFINPQGPAALPQKAGENTAPTLDEGDL